MKLKNTAAGGRGIGVAGVGVITWAAGEVKDVDDAIIAKAKQDPANAALLASDLQKVDDEEGEAKAPNGSSSPVMPWGSGPRPAVWPPEGGIADKLTPEQEKAAAEARAQVEAEAKVKADEEAAKAAQPAKVDLSKVDAKPEPKHDHKPKAPAK